TGLRIDVIPRVLEHRLDVTDIFAGLAIELPQDPVLADREQVLLVVGIYEHALEHDVEIERLAGRVLEIPGELAGVRIECDRRTGEESLVGALHPAAD